MSTLSSSGGSRKATTAAAVVIVIVENRIQVNIGPPGGVLYFWK